MFPHEQAYVHYLRATYLPSTIFDVAISTLWSSVSRWIKKDDYFRRSQNSNCYDEHGWGCVTVVGFDSLPLIDPLFFFKTCPSVWHCCPYFWRSIHQMQRYLVVHKREYQPASLTKSVSSGRWGSKFTLLSYRFNYKQTTLLLLGSATCSWGNDVENQRE